MSPAPTAELDATRIPPATRHAEIFRTFDALGAGESFVLINDHDPRPLLYQFQTERSGAFDWRRLEAGPARFRIEIRRRARPASGVSEYLGEDHARLDAILPEVDRRVAAKQWEEAAARFEEFSCGLTAHIAAEEEVLFPTLERHAPHGGGPVGVMRHEHAEIVRLLDRIADALHGRSDTAYAETAGSLRDVLGAHNIKEEQVLYPMVDGIVSGRDREDLLRRLQVF